MNFPKFLFVLFIFISCKNELPVEIPLDANLKKAEYFYSKKQFDKAYEYYNNSLEFNKKANIKKRVIYCLLMIADIERIECDYVKSEETITIAKALFDDDTHVSYRTKALNILGLNYTNLNDFDAALKVYQEVFNTTDNELTRDITKNNIAYVYSKKGEFKKAISILTEIENNKHILDSLSQDHNRELYARVLHNKGFYLFHLKEKNALEYMQRALIIREKDKNDSEIVSSYMHLAEYYLNKDNNKAYGWAFKAYESASKANIPDDKLEALNLLFKSSDNINFKDKYYDEYIRINDSLIKKRKEAKNQFANIKYESSNAIKDAENQKSQKIIYLLLFVVSVLSGVFIFYFIRKKNKEKLLKTAYDTETRISKRLHDELANDVFNTMMYLETQDLVEQTRKDKVLGNLENIYEKARNISKQTSGVNTGKDFGETIKEMLLSYKSDRVNIIKKGNNTIKWETVAIEKQIEIHRVLQEVLVNMKKHSEATLVVIVFENLEKSIRIKYSDNGIGFDMEKISKNGVRNMENRMHSINGSITFDSEINKGVKINIEFPK